MRVTFRDIGWFAVVALIVVFLSKCHRDEKTKLDDHIADVTEKIREDSIAYHGQLKELEGSLAIAQHLTDSVTAKAHAENARLDASQTTVARLAAALRRARLLPVDSNFITVAPSYVYYCDSLATETETLQTNFNNLRSTQNLLINGKDRVIRIKDSLLGLERSYSGKCRGQLGDLQAIYARMQDANKPRNQVFVGAEILGTSERFMQNVGAVVSLKTKRNKLYQVSSGVQSNGQVYGRINANLLITFK